MSEFTLFDILRFSHPFPKKHGIVPSNLWNTPQLSRHFILISCDNSFSLYLHKP